MSVLSRLVESIVDMPGEFAEVATQGPIEGLLVLSGAILVGAPLVFFSLLVLGALVDLVTPESFGATHP
jgi:hypothetical protein